MPFLLYLFSNLCMCYSLCIIVSTVCTRGGIGSVNELNITDFSVTNFFGIPKTITFTGNQKIWLPIFLVGWVMVPILPKLPHPPSQCPILCSLNIWVYLVGELVLELFYLAKFYTQSLGVTTTTGVWSLFLYYTSFWGFVSGLFINWYSWEYWCFFAAIERTILRLFRALFRNFFGASDCCIRGYFLGSLRLNFGFVRTWYFC